MKKAFKFYLIVWTLCLALFNAITFITPNEAGGMNKFGGAFWVGYIFITVAFICQLVCIYIAFRAENYKKMFYNIPIVSVSYIGLVVMLVAGVLAMAIPNLPNWIGIIVCLLVLIFTAISVFKVSVASNVVSDIDVKIATKTDFIKSITMNVQSLINRANAPMLKEQCKKVYDVLRYSDPMSTDKLADIEQRINEEFDALTDAVIADDLNTTVDSSKEIIALIKERNNMCKSMK